MPVSSAFGIRVLLTMVPPPVSYSRHRDAVHESDVTPEQGILAGRGRSRAPVTRLVRRAPQPPPTNRMCHPSRVFLPAAAEAGPRYPASCFAPETNQARTSEHLRTK